MNVLVIGGNGLFGRKTVLELLQDTDISRVVSMDVIPPKAWIMSRYLEYGEKFKYARGDVSELEDILNIIRIWEIDKIVNWAFLLPGDIEGNPRLSVKVNELGMCNAFEAARLTGISRVIYASSWGVYGPQDEYGDRDVTEDDHLHPGSAYALTKQLSEILAAQYTELYGINFTALRPTIAYGHGARTPAMIKNYSDLVSLPAVGMPFSIDQDGTSQISLFTPNDIGAFTRLLLHVDASPHPAYNVGGPPTSMRQVADAVYKYIPDAKIEFGDIPPPENRGKFGIPYRASSERARQDFGFSLLTLEEAVTIHINDARSEAGLELIK
ncbi:MAG: NAD(P)-dependent oxidoreductase [Dehalococcoidales bacterium]|nr:MAG: NAD(P)-dependent oxidoreductase [Dehalococcoidales bacterium]